MWRLVIKLNKRLGLVEREFLKCKNVFTKQSRMWEIIFTMNKARIHKNKAPKINRKKDKTE